MDDRLHCWHLNGPTLTVWGSRVGYAPYMCCQCGKECEREIRHQVKGDHGPYTPDAEFEAVEGPLPQEVCKKL